MYLPACKTTTNTLAVTHTNRWSDNIICHFRKQPVGAAAENYKGSVRCAQILQLAATRGRAPGWEHWTSSGQHPRVWRDRAIHSADDWHHQHRRHVRYFCHHQLFATRKLVNQGNVHSERCHTFPVWTMTECGINVHDVSNLIVLFLCHMSQTSASVRLRHFLLSTTDHPSPPHQRFV